MLYSTWLSLFIITIFNLGANVSGRAQFGKQGLAGRQDVAHVDPATLTTNAARMAAGLTPLKPRNMYHPTRIGARTPQTSIIPPITSRVEIRTTSGGFLGYIDSIPNIFGFGRTGSTSNAMTITFTPTMGAGAAPFNILINNPGTHPYLGFAGDTLTNQPPHVMVRTNPTSPGSVPSVVGNSRQANQPKSESAIWSYNPSNQRLTPQWINPNGGSPTTYIWYFPTTNSLGIITNPASPPLNSQPVWLRVV
ncbi:hypothetical protein B0H34DRAFT_523494 [Crassisporium funariophilum]|nr:hypothetical protein B0H34DRAFT_523494 [Crassisporium funariophilum]